MESTRISRAGLASRVRLTLTASLVLFVGYCAAQGDCTVEGPRLVLPPTMQASSADELEARIAVLQRDLDRGAAALGSEAWASAANELGHAQMRMGQATGDSARFELALTAFKRALEVWTPETSPGEWAGVHLNLGAANTLLGRAEESSERIRASADAFATALEVFSSDSEPAQWAAAQNGLGGALLSLAQLEPDAQVLARSMDAFQAALTVRTRERMPEQWAMTRSNLGDAQHLLAERSSRPPCDALQSHIAALEILEQVGPEYREHVMWRVRGDLAASQSPTAESCPLLPADLWPRLESLTADAARAP